MAEYLINGWLAEREKIIWAEYSVTGSFEQGQQPNAADSVQFRIDAKISPGVDRYESQFGKGNETSWLQYSDHVVLWPHGRGKASVISIKANRDRDRLLCARVEPRLISWYGKGVLPDSLLPFSAMTDSFRHGLKFITVSEKEPGHFQLTTSNRFNVNAQSHVEMVS